MLVRVSAITLFIGLVACSSAPMLPTRPAALSPNASRVAVSLKVFIPNRIGGHRADREHLTRRSQGTLHQLFIAANSAGIEVAVYRHGSRTKLITSFTGNISSSSPNCKPASGGRTCSFKIAIRPGGPYDLLFATFDQPPVSGAIPNGAKQLGAAITSVKIAKGKANALKVTVGGVVASTFLYAPQPELFHAIVSNSERLVAGAFDSDGNLIASDGYVDANGHRVTLALTTDTNAGGAITFAPARFSAAPLGGITLTYSALKATTTQLQSGFTTVITVASSTAAPSRALTLKVFAPAFPFIHLVDSGPEDIALLGNTIFVTALVGNKIDHIANGVLGSGTANGPTGVTVASDGNVWFVDQLGGSVGVAFPKNGTFASVDPVYTFPYGSAPSRIANGPDGALWVTEELNNNIQRVPVSGTSVGNVTTYPLPTKSAHPQGITVGPDGALWFAECAVGKIARIPVTATPGSSAQIKEFTIPARVHSYPRTIVAGKDGALWFTDLSSPPAIRRITTTGAVTSFLIPGGHRGLEIAVAPDGALWFTEDLNDSIGRILPTATPAKPNVVEFYAYDSGASPYGIAVAPDGSVYYTEYAQSSIIQMQ